MAQPVSRNHTSICHAGLSSNTSDPADFNLSSAGQIGQRLAVIGDEFNRAYETRIQNKMAEVIRESMYVCRWIRGTMCPRLLLLAALAAVCGLVIKLVLETLGTL